MSTTGGSTTEACGAPAALGGLGASEAVAVFEALAAFGMLATVGVLGAVRALASVGVFAAFDAPVTRTALAPFDTFRALESPGALAAFGVRGAAADGVTLFAGGTSPRSAPFAAAG